MSEVNWCKNAQLNPTSLGAVLLVEDHDDIREVVAMSLSSEGYRVTTATNGQEALAILREKPRRWLALLTDLEMPRLNGADLIEVVRREVFEIDRIILMSGLPRGEPTIKRLSQKNVLLLTKPFESEDLSLLLKAPQGEKHLLRNSSAR